MAVALDDTIHPPHHIGEWVEAAVTMTMAVAAVVVVVKVTVAVTVAVVTVTVNTTPSHHPHRMGGVVEVATMTTSSRGRGNFITWEKAAEEVIRYCGLHLSSHDGRDVLHHMGGWWW